MLHSIHPVNDARPHFLAMVVHGKVFAGPSYLLAPVFQYSSPVSSIPDRVFPCHETDSQFVGKLFPASSGLVACSAQVFEPRERNAFQQLLALQLNGLVKHHYGR